MSWTYSEAFLCEALRRINPEFEIGFRFFEARSEHAEPRVRTVPLSELAQHVSPDMPKISRAERQAQVEQRLGSVYRRRFNDF